MASLQEIQAFALSTLDTMTNGRIDVHIRQRMWASLGPVTDEKRLKTAADMTLGHRARAWLMCECLRSAIPEWDSDKARANGEVLLDPRDEPASAIRYIEEWMAGRMLREDFVRHVERFQDLSFYLFELHEKYPNAELIAHASRSALWVAAWDQASDYEDEYREEDNEVFPADFMIAWLRAGTAPWDPDLGAAARRRAYWRWYIEDAFAQAWSIAYPNG
ncbi:MAG: hypothetical protein H6726_29905 [Sandaracinaceae bacterium]|nr:hypothetical protein [Sandaracinaceae bacterium]